MACSLQLQAQDSTKVQKLLAAQRYVYYANSANPQTGGSRQLSDGYTLTITPEKIVAYLPYFGIAYSAPLDREKAGIEFNTTDFTYTSKPGKKGRTEILIIPKNIKADVREMNLTIFPDGNASLFVSSNQRQSISFEGEITAIKEPKKKSTQ